MHSGLRARASWRAGRAPASTSRTAGAAACTIAATDSAGPSSPVGGREELVGHRLGRRGRWLRRVPSSNSGPNSARKSSSSSVAGEDLAGRPGDWLPGHRAAPCAPRGAGAERLREPPDRWLAEPWHRERRLEFSCQSRGSAFSGAGLIAVMDMADSWWAVLRQWLGEWMRLETGMPSAPGLRAAAGWAPAAAAPCRLPAWLGSVPISSRLASYQRGHAAAISAAPASTGQISGGDGPQAVAGADHHLGEIPGRAAGQPRQGQRDSVRNESGAQQFGRLCCW